MIELKIAIPTYNRPDYIQRQVRDILPQLRKGVSLVVYDNSSDIPVESYFSQEEKKCFSIVRNKFNIGGAANIGKCLAENGDSGWIWMPGDDDQIEDNAVDVILGTICNHRDCCYINFGQKKTTETENFHDFLNFLKIIGALNNSFFQSSCLFNMDKLKPYVLFYYEFLSTWMGQIAMVIKYLEANNQEHCFFTEDRIVKQANVGGWSHLEMIVASSVFMDKFHNQKALMKGTLFKAIGDMGFTHLAQSPASISEKRHYRRFLTHKLGFWNVVKYNRVTLCQYVLSIIVPKASFEHIRSFAASRYKRKL